MKYKFFQRQSGKPGFTLIEMLIVIAITAMISGISVANFRAGEKRKRVVLASDIIINAVRVAQNFAITGRQIEASACVQGKAPQLYIVNLGYPTKAELYGIDKCNFVYLVDSYPYPTDVRIQANGYKIDGVVAPFLRIRFAPPYGVITVSKAGGPVFYPVALCPCNSFAAVTIIVESNDGSVAKTVTVDGVSGRIGD